MDPEDQSKFRHGMYPGMRNDQPTFDFSSLISNPVDPPDGMSGDQTVPDLSAGGDFDAAFWSNLLASTDSAYQLPNSWNSPPPTTNDYSFRGRSLSSPDDFGYFNYSAFEGNSPDSTPDASNHATASTYPGFMPPYDFTEAAVDEGRNMYTAAMNTYSNLTSASDTYGSTESHISNTSDLSNSSNTSRTSASAKLKSYSDVASMPASPDQVPKPIKPTQKAGKSGTKSTKWHSSSSARNVPPRHAKLMRSGNTNTNHRPKMKSAYALDDFSAVKSNNSKAKSTIDPNSKYGLDDFNIQATKPHPTKDAKCKSADSKRSSCRDRGRATASKNSTKEKNHVSVSQGDCVGQISEGDLEVEDDCKACKECKDDCVSNESDASPKSEDEGSYACNASVGGSQYGRCGSVGTRFDVRTGKYVSADYVDMKGSGDGAKDGDKPNDEWEKRRTNNHSFFDPKRIFQTRKETPSCSEKKPKVNPEQDDSKHNETKTQETKETPQQDPQPNEERRKEEKGRRVDSPSRPTNNTKHAAQKPTVGPHKRHEERRPRSGLQQKERESNNGYADGDMWYRGMIFIGRSVIRFVMLITMLLLILLALVIRCANISWKFVVEYTSLVWNKVKVKVKEKWTKNQSRYTNGGFTWNNKKEATSNGPTQNIRLPSTGEEAIQRLLSCEGKNPYNVLGVSRDASDEDIKKYYRRQAMLVHPDKNTQTGAEEAFKILGHAFEILGDPSKRKAYDTETMEDGEMEEAMKDINDFFTKLHQKMKEAANTMPCENCGGKHMRLETDRQIYSARYCKKCDIRHPAKEGDIWAETSYLGFKWYYYACMDSNIYDVTEWAACQKINSIEPNGHVVQCRFESAGRRRNQHQRPREGEAELNDFLKDLFNHMQYENNDGTQPGPGTGSGMGSRMGHGMNTGNSSGFGFGGGGGSGAAGGGGGNKKKRKKKRGR